MVRGRRNTSDTCENVIHLQRCSGGKLLPPGQFRDCRSASHSWNAALRLKADVCDGVPLQRSAQLEHVTTDGILHLRRGLRIGQNSRIPRVLEMIEKLG